MKEEPRITKYWRPSAAFVYLTICLFDFIIMPVIVDMHKEKISYLISLINGLPSETQMLIINSQLEHWEPLTLMGGGLFHVSFGAILGAAAWSRGKEKIFKMQQEIQTNSSKERPDNPDE